MYERSLKRAYRRRLAAGAATAGAFALAAPAQAANFEVDVLTDGAPSACGVGDCTLRDAITLATANGEADTITFAAAISGTIRLTAGELLVDDPTPNFPLTINGPGAGVLEVSGDADDNGTGDSRVLHITANNAPVSISGLTLTEGAFGFGGAVYANESSSLSIVNGAVTNSDTTGGPGAGIFADSDTSLTLTNSTVSGNDATGNGGGVFAAGPLTVSGSTFSDNASNGFGAAISSTGKYIPLQVTGSVISGNDATAKGGGIHIGGSKYGGRADIVNTTISGNTATDGAAGLFLGGVSGGSRVKVSRSTISGNTGGGSSFGGGIGFDYGMEGIFELVNSTVSGNSATAGGGIAFGTDNEAALVTDTGSVVLNNSTIADNTATSRGGGLYLGRYDPGGGFTSATVPLNSTIVADNRAGGSAQDLDRANGSGGGGFDIAFSLIERKGDAPLIQSPPGSNTLGVDPKLGNLRNNGGSTLTHKPAGASRVVDRGDSSRLATDQRGSPRRVNFGVPDAKTGNGTDIGAVELRRGEVANARCGGKLATIIGGSRVIKGTKRADIISGTNAKNVIRGRGGKDVLCGRRGNDRLIGGPGRDRLLGGPGRDRLLGGGGRDILRGGPGRDRQFQ